MRVELYPESAGAHEFLGDAWAASGDVDRARGSYEEALAHGGDEARVREKMDKLAR
jgi:predicted negative regulator of RcsB-dependent stress response